MIQKLRPVIFEQFAKSDAFGMVFTFMWAFDMSADWEYLVFGPSEEDVYYVELIAPQEVQLERNSTENRLKNKATKRDIEASNQRLIGDDQRYRCESYPGEISFPNYLRLENAQISAQEAAQIIKEIFRFT